MTLWTLIFGFLTLISAIGVVVVKNPLNSALCLIVTLLTIAVHYALLSADFLAAIQVMVYAGAIMVLVVFVIMLLGDTAEIPLVGEGKSDRKENIGVFNWFMATVSGGVMLAVLWFALSKSPFQASSLNVPDGSAGGLGETLYTKYLFPFEITSLLILSAIIGAVMIGEQKKQGLKPGRGLKATRERHSI